jgi:hypothetical protein
VISGIQHFIYTNFAASLVPAWIPGDARAWTYFTGVALIAGGTGLNIPVTSRLAALLSGLMVFSWFWIVHVPRTSVSVSDGIALFEALAVAGIALLLSGSGGSVAVSGGESESGSGSGAVAVSGSESESGSGSGRWR